MRIFIAVVALLLSTQIFASEPDGERLTYVVGCVNCHHQSPGEFMNAPPLTTVNAYSLDQFSDLLSTGVAADGRDLMDDGNVMGIVAVEQFSFLTDSEILAIYNFLSEEWSEERALKEEAKIPLLYKEILIDEEQ